MELLEATIKEKTFQEQAGKIASELLDEISNLGAEIPIEKRNQLIRILTSSEILSYDRKEFMQLTGLDQAGKEVLQGIEMNREKLMKYYNKLVKFQLITPEYKQRLFSADTELINSTEVAVGNTKIKLEDLNDPEVADLGLEKIKNLIKDILEEENSTADQGYFTNVFSIRKTSICNENRKVS